MAAAGTRGSGGAPLQASAAAEGPPYTWDMIVRAWESTPFTKHCSVHDEALKYYRYIGEAEPGVPYDMEGINIPLADDTVDIGTVTRDSEGHGFEVSSTPLQPWSWRAFLTQMKEPIPGLVDYHGGVMSIRCVPFLNTVRPTCATITALTVWDFIVVMADGYKVRLHPRHRRTTVDNSVHADGRESMMRDDIGPLSVYKANWGGRRRAKEMNLHIGAYTNEGDHAPAPAWAAMHWTPLALTPWEAPPPPGLSLSGPAPSPASSSSAPAPSPASSSPAPADAGRLGALPQGRSPSRGDWAAAWWTRDEWTSGGWGGAWWTSGGWGGSSSSWQGWSEDA